MSTTDACSCDLATLHITHQLAAIKGCRAHIKTLEGCPHSSAGPWRVDLRERLRVKENV